jgi:hypothetical protein
MNVDTGILALSANKRDQLTATAVSDPFSSNVSLLH